VGGWGELETTAGNGLLIGTQSLAKPIVFGTNDTERMRIESNGKVGINQPTPTATLEVASPVGGANSGIKLIQLVNNSTASNSYVPIDFSVPTTGLVGQYLATAPNYANVLVNLAPNSVAITSSATAGQLALMAAGVNGYMTFNTGGYTTATERMRITNTGNVGIKTTAPANLLTIAGTGMLQLVANTTGLVCNSTNAGGLYYNGGTYKHYGCNSTHWLALY
jgi:hypothetical protein